MFNRTFLKLIKKWPIEDFKGTQLNRTDLLGMLKMARKKITKKKRKAERRSSPGRRRFDPKSWFETQPVLNTDEACKYMRISRPTFLKLVEERKIHAQKIGRGWKVLRTELDRFLTSS